MYGLTLFGESHGAGVGAVLENIPAGKPIDMDALSAFMRRRQGGGEFTTPRKEEDAVEFLSGITLGKTNGSPLTVFIRNMQYDRSAYDSTLKLPRPGHADLTAYIKWHGESDLSGGGHLSGRLTAAICAAGGVVLQLLKDKSITVAARITEIGGEHDKEHIREKLETLKAAGDSAGGIIECTIYGMPAGIGNPVFDGIENRIAAMMFAIPAVKGIEFGSGFEGARLRGSENNDAFEYTDNGIRSVTNNAGGILGGITTGMPIVFRLAIKPTPSIAVTQNTVDLEKHENSTISVHGRHDVCIALRAVPVVEAMAAIAIYGIIE